MLRARAGGCAQGRGTGDDVHAGGPRGVMGPLSALSRKKTKPGLQRPQTEPPSDSASAGPFALRASHFDPIYRRIRSSAAPLRACGPHPASEAKGHGVHTSCPAQARAAPKAAYTTAILAVLALPILTLSSTTAGGHTSRKASHSATRSAALAVNNLNSGPHESNDVEPCVRKVRA